MRLRNLWTKLALLVASIALPACGGSSSETPEPVRPDAWQLKLRQPKGGGPLQAGDDQSGTAAKAGDLDAQPAKSTWGKPPRSTAAPATAEPPPALKLQ